VAGECLWAFRTYQEGASDEDERKARAGALLLADAIADLKEMKRTSGAVQ